MKTKIVGPTTEQVERARALMIAIPIPTEVPLFSEARDQLYEMLVQRIATALHEAVQQRQAIIDRVAENCRWDAHQYRCEFYTFAPHVGQKERNYRAKMLEEIAAELQCAAERKEEQHGQQ